MHHGSTGGQTSAAGFRSVTVGLTIIHVHARLCDAGRHHRRKGVARSGYAPLACSTLSFSMSACSLSRWLETLMYSPTAMLRASLRASAHESKHGALIGQRLAA